MMDIDIFRKYLSPRRTPPRRLAQIHANLHASSRPKTSGTLLEAWNEQLHRAVPARDSTHLWAHSSEKGLGVVLLLLEEEREEKA